METPISAEVPDYDPRVEKFQLHDQRTSMNTPVRNLTDEQLLRAWRKVKQQHGIANQKVAEAVTFFAGIQATLALIDYEIDRRRRSGIQIATSLPT